MLCGFNNCFLYCYLVCKRIVICLLNHTVIRFLHVICVSVSPLGYTTAVATIVRIVTVGYTASTCVGWRPLSTLLDLSLSALPSLSFAMAAFEFLLVVFCERMVATSESMTDMPE